MRLTNIINTHKKLVHGLPSPNDPILETKMLFRFLSGLAMPLMDIEWFEVSSLGFPFQVNIADASVKASSLDHDQSPGIVLQPEVQGLPDTV